MFYTFNTGTAVLLYHQFKQVQNIFRNKISQPRQYLYTIIAVLLVSTACYGLHAVIGYRTVALILLVTVSLIAMVFEIYPVLLAAVLSALIWNFFFIEPKFTFHIHSTEDALMFSMYFIIALLNAVLTVNIRQQDKIEQRKEEKENTLKLYSTLLNSLSHELRTPIATIIGATDNLQNNSEKLSDQNKNELLTEISKASLRLNTQVENLLNMSRLESGMLQLKKDWCDVSELVYDVVNRLKDAAGQHHLQIDINESMPLFKIDLGLMEQVIYNLLSNAYFYTPAGSTIRIKVDFDHHEAGHFENEHSEDVSLVKDKSIDSLRITIEDNGPGFPPEEIYHIFDKFYRLKNSRTGGTGLGLSIVKGFVEVHDGLVIAENVPTGGARFTLIIPAETSYLNNLKNE
jgi:two-component system sensor histidine kinase KdpD